MKIRSKLFCVEMALVAASLASCAKKEQVASSPVELQTLPVTEIVMKDTTLHHNYVADIEAVRNVELRARVQGFLEKIYVDEGQNVKKGQLLFSINKEEYKAELAKAKANLSSAIAEAKAVQLEMDRVKMLVDKKVISETELEVVKSRHNAAKAKIEEAKSAEANAAVRLSYTSIRSPFDGIIDRIPFKVGSLIDHGTLLTSVSDVQQVYAYFNVSEGEYLEYVKSRMTNAADNDNNVDLVLADGSNYPYKGKIETVEGEFQNSTGSIAFRARFPNPDKLLKHGASGTISLSNSVHNAVMVPQKAVFEIQDKNYVFLVDENNTVKMTSFVPGARFSYYYIVEEGLKPGNKIVYEGIQSIRDGMIIQPKSISADSLIALN